MKPINANDPVIGSIISLDKLFEDKLGDVGDAHTNYDDGEIALKTRPYRQSRNNSRTVQLEYGYDKCNNTLASSAPAEPQTKSKKHFRSASCDVKMIRSFAKDHNNATNNGGAIDAYETSKFKNLKKLHTHSRNNSSDLNSDFRHKLVAHSNSCSRDDANFGIRFIQNQLKPQTDEEDEDELTTGCGHFVRKHSRNHSYDQIYMPNNIRFDPEFFRGHHHHHHNNNKKNVNLLNNAVDCSKVKNSNECSEVAVTTASDASRGHSRNNSKDLNVKASAAGINLVNPSATTGSTPLATLGNIDATLSILRHRRTNSKDMNYTVGGVTISSNDPTVLGTVATSTNLKKHSRNSSHQKIEIDDDRSGLIDMVNDVDDEDEEEQTEIVKI